MLEILDLSVHYGGVGAVRGADLVIEDGEITALVGPSGCGKTSLLRAIAGFEVPTTGTIRLGGVPVAGSGFWIPPEERNVGMVFQDGALFPHLSVRDNVGYGVSGDGSKARTVEAALDLVGMGDLAGRYPDELSGGQQQRVALARALAPSPRLILLDEPFASLDTALRARVRDEVRTILEAAGICAIVVTHDQEEALSFADSVAVMMAGRVLQVGRPEAIYQRPSSVEVARFIGEGQLVDCTVSSGRFSSVFGSATCEAPDGPGLLLVRPEDLTLVRWLQGDGVPGTVVERRFFGHDVLDTVALSTDLTVAVRSLSSAAVPVGSPVRLTLKERTYQVFPKRGNAALEESSS